jgi:hypothetical protein
VTILFRVSFIPISSLKNLKIKVYKTIILSVLYVCEIWSVTRREEHRFRVFREQCAEGNIRASDSGSIHTLLFGMNII